MQTRETIYFSRLKGPYGLLPDFAATPVEMDEVFWSTTEHEYQAQKFLRVYRQELVRVSMSAGDAARIGRANRDLHRSDWAEIKIPVMHAASRHGIRQRVLP